MIISIILGLAGSRNEKVSLAELEYYNRIHILPEFEKSVKSYKRSLLYGDLLIISGILLIVILFYYWVLPMQLYTV